MSYLAALRLHFKGTFKASPSTVNNAPKHFDVDHFQPSYQLPPVPMNLNGYWNPTGDHVFRLIKCSVTSAFFSDGTPVPPSDPVIGAVVADSNRRAPAKIVDLDPEQQFVSTIFGLELRLGDSHGADWLRGQFAAASLFDLWNRTPTAGGDTQLGAAYQSVLTDLEPLQESGSPWLAQLLEHVGKDGALSIKFNLDGCCVEPTSPDFCMGRIVGTIGPADPHEPKHLILGRHFIAQNVPDTSGYPMPAGKVFNCVAVVDQDLRRVRLDLGNALRVKRPTGPLKNLGNLTLVCQAKGQAFDVGTIDYISQDRLSSEYLDHGGIFDLPPDRSLPPDTIALINSSPLALMWSDPDGERRIGVSETPDGLYVRGDQSVFRLSPGDEVTAEVYATKFGRPHAEAGVFAFIDNSWLQAAAGDPPVGIPAHALKFSPREKTDSQGRVSWPIRADAPGKPRDYIDGQIYGVRFALAETLTVAMNYPFALADYLSLLVWDAFPAPEDVTWCGAIEPIFKLYANLYPAMGRILNLADYKTVCERHEVLLRAFSLDFLDPNFMPLTRDLSPAKQKAIVAWLQGKPPKYGTPIVAGPRRTPPDSDPSTPGKGGAFGRTLLAQSGQWPDSR